MKKTHYDYVVSPGGPYLTLQAAIDHALFDMPNVARILVQPGTYEEARIADEAFDKDRRLEIQEWRE